MNAHACWNGPRERTRGGLIDEYEFLVQPILAGRGPTLVAGLHARLRLELIDPQQFRSGEIALRYRPTPVKVDLLMVMVKFGDAWLTGEAGPPVLYRHRACGEVSHVDPRCSHCGGSMHASDVDVLPGPGLSA